MVNLMVHHQPIQFEVDSGAACTFISEDTYRAAWPRNAPAVFDEDTHVRTLLVQYLPLLCRANVEVEYNGTFGKLPLVILKGTGCSFLGRNWFDALKITIYGINQEAEESRIEPQKLVKWLQKKYEAVFSGEIPGHNRPPVDIEHLPDASPKFLKARPIPFALQPPYERELDKL